MTAIFSHITSKVCDTNQSLIVYYMYLVEHGINFLFYLFQVFYIESEKRLTFKSVLTLNSFNLKRFLKEK